MAEDDVTDDSLPSLTARDVCQVLREVTFERRTLTRACDQVWGVLDDGLFIVDVDGWRIALRIEGSALSHCDRCDAPDGRRWAFDSGHRVDTNPVALLSTWEHAMLESLLTRL